MLSQLYENFEIISKLSATKLMAFPYFRLYKQVKTRLDLLQEINRELLIYAKRRGHYQLTEDGTPYIAGHPAEFPPESQDLLLWNKHIAYTLQPTARSQFETTWIQFSEEITFVRDVYSRLDTTNNIDHIPKTDADFDLMYDGDIVTGKQIGRAHV